MYINQKKKKKKMSLFPDISDLSFNFIQVLILYFIFLRNFICKILFPIISYNYKI